MELIFNRRKEVNERVAGKIMILDRYNVYYKNTILSRLYLECLLWLLVVF